MLTVPRSAEPSPVSPIKAIVSKALALGPELNSYWDVIDLYPDSKNPETAELALAHYNDLFDPANRLHAPLRSVRGAVVDLKRGVVVADAYGYTESLPCHDSLKFTKGPDDSAGTITLETDLNTYMMSVEDAPEEIPKLSIGKRTFDAETSRLFIGYEGALIRIFKWGGKAFFSTHRRIDATRSHWGGRTPFLQLYEELNGPSFESFFGDEEFSPFCYIFLIVHNDIKLASSTSENRLVFIGVKEMWAPGVIEGPESYEMKLPEPTTGNASDLYNKERNKPMITQPAVSVKIANAFMFPAANALATPFDQVFPRNELFVEYNDDASEVKRIYFSHPEETVKDERVSGGDFMILYTKGADGETVIYQLEPLAFRYRSDVTANNPNLYNRFVTEMVTFTKADTDDPESPIKSYPEFTMDKENTVTAQNKQAYWWSIFHDAVPPTYREEVDGYFARFNKDINKVAEYILNRYPKADAEELKRISDQTKARFSNLNAVAVKSATRTKGAFTGPFSILKDLLINETGGSMYRMITTVKNIDKMKQKQEQAAKTISVDTTAETTIDTSNNKVKM